MFTIVFVLKNEMVRVRWCEIMIFEICQTKIIDLVDQNFELSKIFGRLFDDYKSGLNLDCMN